MNGFAFAQARYDNAAPPEPTEGSSQQTLGALPVLVQFDGWPDGLEIVSVVIDGYEVPFDLFAADTLAGWCDAIRAELARDAELAEQAALEF